MQREFKSFFFIFLIGISCSFHACVEKEDDNFKTQFQNLKNGIWKADFEINDSLKIPVLFGITNNGYQNFLEIINNNKVSFRQQIHFEDSTFKVIFPFQNSSLKIKYKGKSLNGIWIQQEDTTRKNISFIATQKQTDKSITIRNNKKNISGIWQIEVLNKKNEIEKGQILIENKNNKINLIIKTENLYIADADGVLDGNLLNASYFDGINLINIRLKIELDNSINGHIVDVKNNTKYLLKGNKTEQKNLTAEWQNKKLKNEIFQAIKLLDLQELYNHKSFMIGGSWNLESYISLQNKLASNYQYDSLNTKHLILLEGLDYENISETHNSTSDISIINLKDSTEYLWKSIARELNYFPIHLKIDKKTESVVFID